MNVKQVLRQTGLTDAKLVAAARAGQIEFSHPNGVPVLIDVTRTGFFRWQITATALESLWYRDAAGTTAIAPDTTCNLASVPPCCWWWVTPFELAYESFFHDVGYAEQKMTRRYVDFQFFYLMEARGKSWWVRYPVWIAVRLFGGKAWERCRLAREVKP